jgi:large subunit ribosomal protein L29
VKTSELRELSYAELGEKLDDAKQELFNLRFQLATNQLDNTARIGQVKKEIARVMTIMREQEIAEYYRREPGDE